MRRIDVIGISVGILVAGAIAYGLLQGAGLDSLEAGIWSQVLLVGGLLGWVMSYLTRVLTQKMTYNQQIDEYKQAVLKKQLEQMTPEQIAQLQAQADAESEKDS